MPFKNPFSERRLLAFSQNERDRLLDADEPQSPWESALDQAKQQESDTLKQVRAIHDKPVEAFKDPRFTVKSWSGFKNWWNSFDSVKLRRMKEEYAAETQEGKKREMEAAIAAEAEGEWKQELADAEARLTGAATDAQRFVLLQGRILGRDVALAAGRVESCKWMIEGIDGQIAVLVARQKQFRDLAALVAGGGLAAERSDVEIPGLAALKQERARLLALQGGLEEQARELIARRKPDADEKRAGDLDSLMRTVLTSADESAAVDLDEVILEAVTDNTVVRNGELRPGAARPGNRLETRLKDLVKRGKLTREQEQRLLEGVRTLRTSNRAGTLSYFAKKTQKRLDDLPAGRVLNKPDIKDRVGMLAFMKQGEAVKIGNRFWSVSVPNKDGKFTVLVGEDGLRAVVEREEDNGKFLMRVLRYSDGSRWDASLTAPPVTDASGALKRGFRQDVLYMDYAAS